MAYESRFDGRADHYSAARPAYSEDLIDWLYRDMGFTPDTVIADIGCGTGKLSAQLLQRGSTVYGVEPNEGMRKKAAAAMADYPRFRLFPGNDAHTGLPDVSVDAIVVGQAFHWFDPEAFRRECRRIAKPGAKVFLIWNLRNQDYEVNRQWTAIFEEFADNFIGFNNGLVEDDPRIRTFFAEGYEKQAFRNDLTFTREIFLRRLLSSSYAPQEGSVKYEAFTARVYDMFERYAAGDRILVPHDSVVYWR